MILCVMRLFLRRVPATVCAQMADAQRTRTVVIQSSLADSVVTRFSGMTVPFMIARCAQTREEAVLEVLLCRIE